MNEESVIKKYNFSNIISQIDTDQTCDIVKQIIDAGNYFDNSPKYQTKENLFARQEAVWLKYRMSFLFSCFMYLGHETKVKGINCWSFMTNQTDNQDRHQLWHHHHYDLTCDKLSGIMYLRIPDDVTNFEESGTEFTLSDPEKNESFFVKPEYFTWVIYPSKIWHRPGLCPSDTNRFVLAADMEF